MTYLESLQLFYGEANPARAHLYARVAGGHANQGLRLTGQVAGPYNALASTLPARIPLRDLGPGPTLLAEAVLPDPCFWSPESPALYNVEISIVDERGTVRETATRQFGIRALGVYGANLILEGKRYVLRGADRALFPRGSPSEWREAWSTPLAVSPDDAFLAEASRLGVLTVVHVSGARADVESELLRLSRWAAAAIAIVECSQPLDATIANVAPNLLLGWRMPASEAPPPLWAKVLFADVRNPPSFARQFQATTRPVLAMRRAAKPIDLRDARAACDELQRDLAPYGDFAGYLVF
jgi:hypothetical protein